MARPSLSQISSMKDIQTTYRWDVSFSGAAAATFGLDQGINLRMLSTGLPVKNNEPLEATIRGHKFYQPGQSDPSGDLPMTAYETVDGKIGDMLKAWADACWSEDTGVQLTNAELMAGCLIRLLDRQDQPVREYRLQNVFLMSYEMPELNSDNDSLKPQFTLKYSGFTTNRV